MQREKTKAFKWSSHIWLQNADSFFDNIYTVKGTLIMCLCKVT